MVVILLQYSLKAVDIGGEMFSNFRNKCKSVTATFTYRVDSAPSTRNVERILFINLVLDYIFNQTLAALP